MTILEFHRRRRGRLVRCRISRFTHRARGWRGDRPAADARVRVDMHYAIGASLVSVIATSSGAAAAYVREGYTNIRIGMFLEIATTTGALVGAMLATVLPTTVSIVFGLALLQSAYLSAKKKDEPDAANAPPDRIAEVF